MNFSRLLTVIAIAIASTGFSAFDNTQNNDFWDTTKYVNPAPSVSGASLDMDFASPVFDRKICAMASDSALDSMCFDNAGPVALGYRFLSISPGLFFIVR